MRLIWPVRSGLPFSQLYNNAPVYAFPSIKATGLSSEEFAEELLKEEKVAVVPGTAFGACGEGHIRCYYATSLEEIQEAIRRMGRFVGKHRK